MVLFCSAAFSAAHPCRAGKLSLGWTEKEPYSQGTPDLAVSPRLASCPEGGASFWRLVGGSSLQGSLRSVVGKGWLPLSVCVAVVVLLVVSACGGGEPSPPAGAPPASGSSSPALGEEAPSGVAAGVEDASRPKAPILSGFTLGGEPISTGDFLGRPFVVKVFAEH